MTTHNSEEKDKAAASAELMRLAIRGALVEGVQPFDALRKIGELALSAGLLAAYEPEKAPQTFRLTGAARHVRIVGTITGRASEDEASVPSYSGPGDASCACAHCDDQPGGCVLCCK